MAGRGPAPKPPEKRARRNKDEHPQVTLERGLPKGKAPKLPGERKYSAQTRAWYRTWASSLQAAQFLPTDWQRLHMLAPLVDKYFKSPDTNLLGEIRRNEAALGGTAEDRLRLRWRLAGQRQKEEAEAKRQAKGAKAAAAPAAPPEEDPRLRLVQGGS